MLGTDVSLAEAARLAAMTIEARIVAEWDAACRLPPAQREQACDIVLIKHSTAIQAILRERAIAASTNVVSLASHRRPPLRLVPDAPPPSAA